MHVEALRERARSCYPTYSVTLHTEVVLVSKFDDDGRMLKNTDDEKLLHKGFVIGEKVVLKNRTSADLP